MSCSAISPTTMPASAIHFTTRHQDRKYAVACLGLPEMSSPNSHTQPSMTATAAAKTRN